MAKGLKATKKELLIPLSENQKKNSEVLTPPTTTSPKLFGKIYPFEQKSEKKNEATTTLPPSAVVTTTAYSSCIKLFAPKSKSVMDARVAKKRPEKKARLQKQLSENTEKMNAIKKQKLS